MVGITLAPVQNPTGANWSTGAQWTLMVCAPVRAPVLVSPFRGNPTGALEHLRPGLGVKRGRPVACWPHQQSAAAAFRAAHNAGGWVESLEASAG